jgi:uncharacterized protein (TIGR02466 family)
MEIKQVPVVHADLFLVQNVGTEEERENLKEQVLIARNSNSESAERNNDRCWRGNPRYQNIQWLEKQVLDLSMQILSCYEKQDAGLRQNSQQTERKILLDYWTNVNEQYSVNSLHTHKRDSLAAVYYVQTTGTGAVRFHNPANQLFECNRTSPFIEAVKYEPVDGDLLMWPAWIPHQVELNMLAKQRINIAWNIRVI